MPERKLGKLIKTVWSMLGANIMKGKFRLDKILINGFFDAPAPGGFNTALGEWLVRFRVDK